MSKNNRRVETTCVQGGYTPGNGEPRQIPIIQSIFPAKDQGHTAAYQYR